jgi:hydrocephalus-inducing protein
MVLTMKNISEMRLDYEWTFLQEELVFPPGTSGSQQIESRDSQRTTQKSIPINEIFDILPLSGSLEPGHEEQVEFVYNAFGG